jgi:hypothetical protein
MTDKDKQLQTLIDDAITVTDWQEIIVSIAEKAKGGDLKSAEFLFNRQFGMPKQSIEAKTTTKIEGVQLRIFTNDNRIENHNN